MRLTIDDNIERARTLPGWYYGDEAVWQAQRRELFPRTWHCFAEGRLPEPGEAVPWTLLPDCLDEPLLLTRTDRVRCLSNACTHRGHLVVTERCDPGRALRCGYHGRRFDHEGRCLGAPGFERVEGFPSADDRLTELAVGRLGPLLWTSRAPAIDVDALLEPVRERAGFLPLDRAEIDPGSCRTYSIDANWVLYCDNYLEGFHLPFVHPSLTRTIAVASYRTERLDCGVLQLAEAAEGEPAIEPPAGHPEHGRRIAGYYFFLFPCTMLNFYPWGLSVNVVQPRGPTRTDVRYVTWVYDADKRGRGAGGDLDAVEREDQRAVVATQKGVRGRLYHRGRYAPEHERGVHHFHRLLTGWAG